MVERPPNGTVVVTAAVTAVGSLVPQRLHTLVATLLLPTYLSSYGELLLAESIHGAGSLRWPRKHLPELAAPPSIGAVL